MTAAEFLQREQEKAYGEITRPPVNLGRLVRQNPEALRRRLLGRQRPRSPLEEALKYDEACFNLAHSAVVNLPTRYEDPFTYSMLTAYANDLEEALAKAFNVRFKTRPFPKLPRGNERLLRKKWDCRFYANRLKLRQLFAGGLPRIGRRHFI